MTIGFGVRHGKVEERTARAESLRDLQAALDSAQHQVTGYTAALKDLEKLDAQHQARARAAERAVGEARARLDSHRGRRFDIPLEQVGAWSAERVRLENLLLDLEHYANHVADVARESAATLAGMQRQIERAQTAVKTKTKDLAAMKARRA